jgi:hypothetical protein
MVVGTRPKVLGADVVEGVARCFDIDFGSLAIHQAIAEDFMLFLPDEDTASRVLNEGNFFRGSRFNLQFKRWSRFTHATAGLFQFWSTLRVKWQRSSLWILVH